MPNEIYHRSEWGNPKAEGFGDVYFDAAATNKLYNHSDYYENSDGTDKILRDIPNKASIVLTPTAYSDGSLNTVIPPYQVLPQELVTNGTFDTDSDWNKSSNWTISGGKAVADGSSQGALTQTLATPFVGKQYLLSYEISNYSSGNIRVYYGGVFTDFSTSNGIHSQTITATSTDALLQTSIASPFNGSIDNVSVKEIQQADFDFSRGSSATRVNEKGLIEDVQILSGNLVQNGDFKQIGSELVTNGDFSGGLSDWSVNGGSYAQVVDGVLNSNNPDNGSWFAEYIGQNISFVNGKIYKIAFRAKNLGGDLNLRLTQNANVIFTQNLTSQFVDYTVYYVANADNGSIRMFCNDNVGQFAIDNVSVKEVGQNWTFGTGWSIGEDKAVFDDTTTNRISQTGLSITSGKSYKINFTIADCPTTAHMTIYDGGGSDLILPNENYVNGSYTRYYTATTNETGVSFWGNTAGDTFSITNISVIEITDDTDIPRIDYTSGQGALLLEPQSTNLIPYSEDFNNASWIKQSGITVSDNDIISPDGTQNADKITTTSGSLFMYDVLSLTPSTEYTVSFYIKNDNSNNTRIWGAGEGSFDMTWNGGQLVSITQGSFEYFGNEWYKVSVTQTSQSDGQYIVRIYPNTEIVTTNSIYLWGFQLEQGSYPTSIIKTEGSTVTRSADVANNSGNADLFNDSEGVLYAEIAALADDATNRKIAIGTSSNRIIFGYKNSSNQIRVEVISSGSVVFDNSQTIDDVTTFSKFAIKYKQNDFALWMNGEEIAIDTSGNPPIGLSELAFDDGGSNNFYGNVKSVAVFKEALTDAELESLTSWVSFTEMATDLEYTLE